MSLIDLARLSEYARTAIREKLKPPSFATIHAPRATYNQATGLVPANLDQHTYSLVDGDGFTVSADGLVTYTGARLRRPTIRAEVAHRQSTTGTGVFFLCLIQDGVEVVAARQVGSISQGWTGPAPLVWTPRAVAKDTTFRLAYFTDPGTARTIAIGDIVWLFS